MDSLPALVERALAEVASSAAETATAAGSSQARVAQSQQSMEEGVRAANQVVDSVKHSNQVIGELNLAVGKIGAIAQVIKENWRGIGVGVRAPDGDLWFFRLVGPDDAVQSARSPFLAMLETLSAEGSKAP